MTKMRKWVVPYRNVTFGTSNVITIIVRGIAEASCRPVVHGWAHHSLFICISAEAGREEVVIDGAADGEKKTPPPHPHPPMIDNECVVFIGEGGTDM